MRKTVIIFSVFFFVIFTNLFAQQQKDSLGRWSFELTNGITHLSPTGYYSGKDFACGYKFGAILKFKIYKRFFCSAGAGYLFLNEKNYDTFFPDTFISYHYEQFQCIDFPFQLGWIIGQDYKWKGYISLGTTLGILIKSKSVSTNPNIVMLKKNIWAKTIGVEGSAGVRYLLKENFYLFSQLDVFRFSAFQYIYKSSNGYPIDEILYVKSFDLSFGFGLYFHKTKK
jgi:hypothetical protein